MNALNKKTYGDVNKLLKSISNKLGPKFSYKWESGGDGQFGTKWRYLRVN